ncbi:GMP synthase (glutamine-hydrolyzing)- putative / glutamine amidotransferase- putative [Striga hermonthica]|uniref:GMP synthase [glutamine-hydrolyzing] n=1 Tax=Striga hermonthica TaxID=68872 RepID=A0A9N7MNT6_STRHE|nr:GMP synthase (glutamine-hydrolyzing)- putative / glutamine amidotransferase- putative [Striga hermonthica]
MEAQDVKSNLVLILDFGSQYTHLITRRIRALNVFSLCINGTSPLKAIADLNPRVIILSGGPHSVHTTEAPCFAPGFIDYVESNRVRVLGICYGLQLIVQQLGGEVRVGEKHEYGRMEIEVEVERGLFGNRSVGDRQSVWMSHGDEAVRLPEGFQVVGRSKQGAIAALQNQEKGFYGLQYHPEVTHSQPGGMETLKHFLFDLCGITAGWKMEDVLEEELKIIKTTVSPDDHVICALSGGVDSTVAATLVHKAIGDRLHCVFVDNGLLRWQERERVMETFERDLHLPVTCVDAVDQFLSKLKGVTEPEKKRKIIGNEFINIFDAFAHDLEGKLGKKPAYLVQGTLYPDVIESCPPPGSGRTHSHTIKSHHNVGGLPKDMKLKLIEPLKLLFKDEVRELGRIMGVPQGFLKRHPFPGPGLAVRVPGDVTLGNRLDILRKADEIFIQAIKDAGIYDSIWQAFAVFMPVLTVGVQGDQRTHSYAITLRAVTSQDGMTADWYYFDHKFLADLSTKICNEVAGVNRVLLDITSKPPSTIEWE